MFQNYRSTVDARSKRVKQHRLAVTLVLLFLPIAVACTTMVILAFSLDTGTSVATIYREGDKVPMKMMGLTSNLSITPPLWCEQIFALTIETVLTRTSAERLHWWMGFQKRFADHFDLRMKEDMRCRVAWESYEQSYEQLVNTLEVIVVKNYHHNWMIEAAEPLRQQFPVGMPLHNGSFTSCNIYNHFNITISYQEVDSFIDDDDGRQQPPTCYRILGFHVNPQSLAEISGSWTHHAPPLFFGDFGNNTWVPPVPGCNENSTGMCTGKETCHGQIVDDDLRCHVQNISLHNDGELHFTLLSYDVTWARDDTFKSSVTHQAVSESSRATPRTNNVMPLCLLMACQAMLGVMITSMACQKKFLFLIPESTIEKLSADIFRPPSAFPIVVLAVSCGTGFQMICSIFGTSLVAFAAKRCFELTKTRVILLLHLCLLVTSCLQSFVATVFCKTFQGEVWRQSLMVASLLVPFYMWNLLPELCSTEVLRRRTSDTSFFELLMNAFGPFVLINTSLVSLGILMGCRIDTIKPPFCTSKIPRSLPDSTWLNWWPTSLLACVLTSALVCYPEVRLTMEWVWMDASSNYGLGRFLLALIGILVVNGEVAALATLFVLRSGRCGWWWQSYLNGASIALWVALHSRRFQNHLELRAARDCYLERDGEMFDGSWTERICCQNVMAVVCCWLFFVAGSIGFACSLFVNWVIVSSFSCRSRNIVPNVKNIAETSRNLEDRGAGMAEMCQHNNAPTDAKAGVEMHLEDFGGTPDEIEMIRFGDDVEENEEHLLLLAGANFTWCAEAAKRG